MPQVQVATCPSSNFAVIQDMESGSNWNGRNAEESLSLQDGTEKRNIHKMILGKCQALGNWFRSRRVLTVLLVSSVLLNVALVVAVLSGKSHGEIPVTPKDPCFVPSLEAWDQHNSVCYYLLNDEGTWEQAQNRCSELGASLAVLSDKAMDHLLSPSQDQVFRLTGNLDYWLGLRRRGERFQWVDGSSYNSSLEVLGNSECVYLADHKLRSEDCSKQLPYLCSKPQPHL
ncbi:early activation antigen CD69-like isoform X2 [Chiroxiphia lanceolata]|uniref:early activation antigen CD69-like isoform X2 n=1 Tax=Chiroxiphia lanceolata TaxID=296741 RepID=UPI0013CEBC8B|nr:early activation antigen CD69-like isoform X2 [Chiroxiphia lanceolata]